MCSLENINRTVDCVCRWATPAFDSSHDDFDTPLERPEAPYGHVQIERIREVLTDLKI